MTVSIGLGRVTRNGPMDNSVLLSDVIIRRRQCRRRMRCRCWLLSYLIPSMGRQNEHQLSRWLILITMAMVTAQTTFCIDSSYRHVTTSCSIKRETSYSWWYLCQISTDFQNSFTGWFPSKLAIKRLLKILPVLTYVWNINVKNKQWTIYYKRV